MKTVFRLVAYVGLLFVCNAQGPSSQERPPIVAAASNVKPALEDLARRFELDTGRKLSLNFGSSGNFVRQIRQGAPFELFLSADEDFVFLLADAGLTTDRGALYAVGRIALFVPKGSPIALDGELRGVRANIDSIRRFAIANPEHSPYGRAAEQALRSLALWEPLSSKIVMGENIAQAAQFVTTGSAQAGIVALSLALAPEVARLGDHVVLPERLHEPLRQRMALMKGAGETAAMFYRYLQQPPARAVFRKYGFSLPGE